MTALPEGSYADIGDGLKMHYHDVGPAGGAPLVFLHGSGPGASGYSNFRHNAAVFAEQGYRSLLVDSLGYGHSSKPETDYSLSFMGGGVVKLLDAIGLDNVTLVGNSQGGAQAIWIALNHPGRVERLVLMAPGGLEARETYMQLKGIRSMLRCIYGEEGITLFGLQKVFEKQLFDASGLDPQVVQNRYDIAMTQPRYVFERMRVDNQEGQLFELKMPILCLWGMNDVFCPPSGAHKIAEHCDNARVVLLTRCGHWVMVEHADVFNRYVLDFLAHG